MTTLLLPVHEQLREDQRLGAAWRRCEATLPETGRVYLQRRHGARTAYEAAAADVLTGEEIAGFTYGATPAAALEALADALESRE